MELVQQAKAGELAAFELLTTRHEQRQRFQPRLAGAGATDRECGARIAA
jgi:hypothetical protein